MPCGGYHADVEVHENLLIQSIDSASSNTGCLDALDPEGVDQAEVAGIRIYDITDPANSTVTGFVNAETLQNSVHNFTTLPWAGVGYVAGSSFSEGDPGNLTIVDFRDPDFPVKVIPMEEISPTATAECHDIGVAKLENRSLAFCAAVEQTFIWDITDPMTPTHVAVVPLAVESVHHAVRLAPDGETLVLNDELGGAAAAPGCLATTHDPIGALWFYDISDPSSPQLEGTFSTSELAAKNPCTSHFFNFIPGSTLLTVGWYRSGMIVVDYGNLPQTSERAVFTPRVVRSGRRTTGTATSTATPSAGRANPSTTAATSRTAVSGSRSWTVSAMSPRTPTTRGPPGHGGPPAARPRTDAGARA